MINKKTIITCGIGLTLAFGIMPMNAQNALPQTTIPLIVTPHNQNINYRDRSMIFDVQSNVDYTIKSNVDWLTAKRKGNGSIIVHASQNFNSEERTGKLTFQHSNLTKEFTITQGKDESIEFLVDNSRVVPSSATANKFNAGENIDKTYDNNTSTLFHSPYSGYQVSESNPIILTYNFSGADVINNITYVPRTSGGNGNFGKVKILYKLKGDSDYKEYGSYDWKYSSSKQIITIPDGLKNPVSIQFVVTSGSNDFASCAEMEFGRKEEENSMFSMFSDNMLTTLKPNVTQNDIDTISNPFVKSLATQIFNKTYEQSYRVGTYSCKISPNTLSDEWNAPGKHYDLLDGPTGINITPGKHAIYVSGLNDGQIVPMSIVAWYSQDLVKNDNGETTGGGPSETSYNLHNGMNVITYNGKKDGLAYICYYANTREEVAAAPKMNVHFINAQVNGYLSPEKTNDEMDAMVKKAPNRCIDVYGSKVHSVWEAEGLAKYCKTTTGALKGYRQYMNVLDSLVYWEQDLLGFMKYGREPKGSHTMAYVNYTYYMFQGWYGVSFKYDCQSRVLNCQTIVYNDDDAIWGLSHEWGHQHQMTPYFCWSGLSESSNNMNSCYNVLHMGYSGNHGARIQSNWTAAYNHFVKGQSSTKLSYQYVGSNNGNYTKSGDNYTKVADGNGDYAYLPESGVGSAGLSHRAEALKNINAFSWCPAFQDSIRKQAVIVPSVENVAKSLSTNEVYVEENTAPFFMLYCYFSANGVPDFQKDLYESLRQNDDENGSTVEKQSGVDKYELLASAQNGNKNKKYSVFKEKYPTSCWNTQKYIKDGMNYTQNSVPFIFNYIRKASRLSGYNLFPFFDKFGFMREICLYMDDYGAKYYAMSHEMKEEFKKDMDDLNLKTMDDAMFEKISHSNIPTFNTPVFPN